MRERNARLLRKYQHVLGGPIDGRLKDWMTVPLRHSEKDSPRSAPMRNPILQDMIDTFRDGTSRQKRQLADWIRRDLLMVYAEPRRATRLARKKAATR